jgi:hypothetical protein
MQVAVQTAISTMAKYPKNTALKTIAGKRAIKNVRHDGASGLFPLI